MPITNVLTWPGRSEATHANNQDLKEFIRAEMAALRAEMAALRSEVKADMAAFRVEIKGEIRAEIAALRAEMHSALREQLMRFIAIVFGLVTLATAIIKLFPNWH